MSAAALLVQIEDRGRAMRAFVERVRERGEVAVVEEQVDLPALRRRWAELRSRTVLVGRLDELGPTPVDAACVAALRRQILRATKGGRP
jgi:hypothetical protein